MSETKPSDSDHSQAILSSPIPGVPFIAVHTEQGRLRAIKFLQQPITVNEVLDPRAEETIALLRRYFCSVDTAIPAIRPLHGTPFQYRVWEQLQQIPVGQSRSYGEIARELGSGAQAVAGACRANPLPILIPCHRVVAANGLGGYMGQLEGETVAIKRWLLHYEGHV